MRGLIERADGVKMQRARERLAEVRAKVLEEQKNGAGEKGNPTTEES
jgi:hypothetical protein